VGVGLALKFFTGFPWQVTFAALLDADRWLLVIALAVNLSSLAAKGWGWHLILKPVAPHSWRVAQEANLVGAAVNDLSVAVAGEAARVHLIVQRGGVPAGAAVASVVWTRVAEGLALALFLVMAPSVLQLEPWLRAVQSGVGLALVWCCCSPGGAAGRRSPTGCRHRSGRGSPRSEPWERAAGCCGPPPSRSTIGPLSGPRITSCCAPRTCRCRSPRHSRP